MDKGLTEDRFTRSMTRMRGKKARNASAGPTDHGASKKRLNRIKGQLDAIARMIDDREYCPNIIQQIRAATSALRSLEAEVLRGHIRGCVKRAFEAKDPFESHDKIEEILNLIAK